MLHFPYIAREGLRYRIKYLLRFCERNESNMKYCCKKNLKDMLAMVLIYNTVSIFLLFFLISRKIEHFLIKLFYYFKYKEISFIFPFFRQTLAGRQTFFNKSIKIAAKQKAFECMRNTNLNPLGYVHPVRRIVYDLLLDKSATEYDHEIFKLILEDFTAGWWFRQSDAEDEEDNEM